MPIGNRTAFWEGNPLDPMTYVANQLNQYDETKDPEESFAYDEDGNLIQNVAFKTTWNAENRLVKVEPRNPSTGALRVSNAQPRDPARRAGSRGWATIRLPPPAADSGGEAWAAGSARRSSSTTAVPGPRQPARLARSPTNDGGQRHAWVVKWPV